MNTIWIIDIIIVEFKFQFKRSNFQFSWYLSTNLSIECPILIRSKPVTLYEPFRDFCSIQNGQLQFLLSISNLVCRMTTFQIGKDQSVRSIRNWDDRCFMKRSSKFYERNREDLSLALTTTYERTGWLRNSTVSSEERWTFPASVWPIFNIPNQQGFRFSHKTLIKSLGTFNNCWKVYL